MKARQVGLVVPLFSLTRRRRFMVESGRVMRRSKSLRRMTAACEGGDLVSVETTAASAEAVRASVVGVE